MTEQEAILNKQQELNKEKRILQMITSYSPAEYEAAWLCLAAQYAAIGSQANHAYCLAHAKHYAPKPEPTPEPEPEPAHEYNWQEWTNA